MTSTSQRTYRAAIRTISVIFVVLGVAMVVRTLTAGGDVLAMGLILGILFIVLGLARLAMSRR